MQENYVDRQFSKSQTLDKPPIIVNNEKCVTIIENSFSKNDLGQLRNCTTQLTNNKNSQ